MTLLDNNGTLNSGNPIYHDYLLFLEPNFQLLAACRLDNIGFILCIIGLLNYFMILIFFKICRRKPVTNNEHDDEKMANIIKDYKKELEVRQTSLATTITDFNMTSKSESFFMMNNSSINVTHGLPFFGADSTSGEAPNFGENQKNSFSDEAHKIPHDSDLNQNEISLVQAPKIEIPGYKDIKKEASEIEQQSEDERREKARKEIVAPPTFSDRFEIMAAAKNMEKQPINNIPSSSTQSQNEQEIILVKAKKVGKTLGLSTSNNKMSPKTKDLQKKKMFRGQSKSKAPVTTSRGKLLKAKFWQLFLSGNPIISTFYQPESRFFPKHLRLTFLYFYVSLTSLLATFPLISTINKSLTVNSLSYLMDTLVIGFFGWLLFFLFIIFFTVKKDAVLKTQNDNDLQTIILRVDKEVKLNIVLAYIVIHVAGLICLAQVIALPLAVSIDLFQTWFLVIPIVSLFYQILLDITFFMVLASIYVFAKEKKSMKRLYLFLSRVRAWKL